MELYIVLNMNILAVYIWNNIKFHQFSEVHDGRSGAHNISFQIHA